MQAQGNDFVILNYLSTALPSLDFEELARAMCTRRFSIGADGLVLLTAAEGTQARMIIYNSDGSRAEMCGSALRCVSSLCFEHFGLKALNIITDSGIKSAELDSSNGVITVNLGSARLLKSEFCADDFCGDLVDIGNPHFVLWRDSLDDDPHLQYGAFLEHHPAFETPVNVHFARKISSAEIQLKIWEHACGATLACGTGAASTVYSGILRGLLDSAVKVQVPGGEIGIRYIQDTEELLLCGIVHKSFTGSFSWKA